MSMTRLFGVIGSPIGHSLSPVMHAAAFRALGLDARYVSIEVPPRSLRPMLEAFILAGVEGLNVTVPLKEPVLRLVDRLHPSAAAMGAVNTIVVRGRRMTGHNTDGAGFARALRELGWRPRPGRVLLLGAGGAARAAAWELAAVPGMELIIANRHPARARRLAAWIARVRPRCCVRAVAVRRARVEGVGLVVNATTVGMRASDPPLIDPAALSRHAVVYDLVYQHETRLVREARRRGCVAAGGLSMLLYQGAESFRLWFHRAPPIAAMRTALLRAMRNSECGMRNRK
jgi:shikimate dehydrogenase